MKTIKLFSMLALAASLLSFAPFGGEHYEISVNGAKAIEYAVYLKKEIPTLTLNKTSAHISVLYNDCGHAAKGRKLAIVDDKSNVIKEWKFNDVTNLSEGEMNIDGKEVTALMAKSGSTLNLFYTSVNLKSGRVLAHLNLEGSSVAVKSE
jgi:hypothetical protein